MAWANVRMTMAAQNPASVAGGIGDRLAAAELQLVRPQHERQHAQAMRRGRERDARARGRLLEEAGQRLGRKRVEEAGRSVLHLLRQVEQAANWASSRSLIAQEVGGT